MSYQNAIQALQHVLHIFAGNLSAIYTDKDEYLVAGAFLERLSKAMIGNLADKITLIF